MKPVFSVPFFAVLVLLLQTTIGCGPPVGVYHIEVSIAPGTNMNSPVPLTLVAVQDPKLFEQISKMSAKQWYEQREQMRRDDPTNEAFSEWDWEVVPGQNPPKNRDIQLDERAVGAVIFAKYRSPGDHRQRLGAEQHIRIDLRDADFIIRPLRVSNP